MFTTEKSHILYSFFCRTFKDEAIPVHAVKVYWGIDVWLHLFLPSALVEVNGKFCAWSCHGSGG
jgi:hypothetical protein